MSSRPLQGYKNIVSGLNASEITCIVYMSSGSLLGYTYPAAFCGSVKWVWQFSTLCWFFAHVWWKPVNLNAGPKQVPENAILAQAAQWPGYDLAVT